MFHRYVKGADALYFFYLNKGEKTFSNAATNKQVINGNALLFVEDFPISFSLSVHVSPVLRPEAPETALTILKRECTS